MSADRTRGFPTRRYLDPSLAELVAAWRHSTAIADHDRHVLQRAVIAAADNGASEYALAEACGVARSTIRAWLGK